MSACYDSGSCPIVVATDAVEVDLALRRTRVLRDVLDDVVASVAKGTIVNTAAVGLTILTAGGWLRVEGRAIGRNFLTNIDRADGLV